MKTCYCLELMLAGYLEPRGNVLIAPLGDLVQSSTLNNIILYHRLQTSDYEL